MIKRVVAIVLTLGVLWGVGTWAGDGAPMLSPAWFSAMQSKVNGFLDGSEQTLRDKLPEPGSQLELPPAGGEGATGSGGAQ
ncbi:hypothetical protein [Prescottella subtropica]|uniref:hypothetical protein n=1 Tax=Prescottella subtropica TaxID=2545757 RepID=UPI0010F984A4|nr:hypothetical protein [Prescottella subtropica]